MATLEEEVRSWNQQGIGLAQQGRLDEAAACFRKALQLQPNSAAGLNNLGNILTFQHQPGEAVGCYRAALNLLPQDPVTLNNLGNGLRQVGELEEAVACCRKALSLKPGYAEAHSNLSIALEAQGKSEEAFAHCQRALQLRPEYPEAKNNLSMILRGLGRFDEAVAAAREALRLRPNDGEVLNNLGQTLLMLDRLDEAISCFRQAIQLRPDLAEIRVNLASCYWRQNRLDEAAALCEEVLRLKPNLASALNILGATLLLQGRFDEAMTRFNQTLALDPNLADGHFNRALARLHLGDFQEGWREYEWRWKCKNFVIHPPQRPCWDGTSLAGKTILLNVEQGLGDTLQFIRYAPLVKQRGAKVILACPRSLIPLLSRCAGIDQVVASDGILPDCDTFAPLLSLPGIFGTLLDTIPNQIPYLFADEGLVDHWRRELTPFSGFRVGIAWKGSSKNPLHRYRSIPLTQFAPLALPGVQLLSLQKGDGIEQLKTISGRLAVVDFGERLDETAGAFMDTAAVMKNLDLVITTDTATGHLAGGLGVPVWVALPKVSDWRWLRDREDSPWYPTMRLFRQTATNLWDDVFARIAAALARLIGQHPRQVSIPIEISPGELIDKITILQIKRERFTDPVKLANVKTELELLAAACDRAVPSSPPLTALTGELKKTNLALWDIEEAIRACERVKDFGQRFIELARSVYQQNDRRAEIKREINELLGSKLLEEKSYE